jgi:hypothetical protein
LPVATGFGKSVPQAQKGCEHAYLSIHQRLVDMCFSTLMDMGYVLASRVAMSKLKEP